MKRILAVVRASTERQETESQKRELEQFILKKGFKSEEIKWIVANLSSTQRLDVYQKLLEEIKENCLKGIRNVAFWHLNRLGRREKFLIDMKEFFIENRIQMFCREPEFKLLNDDGSPDQAGSLVYSLLCSIIAGDNRERKEKFKRGKTFAQEAGRYIGGQILFGYNINEKKEYVINPEEAKIVNRIFDMYISRKYSCDSISATLNSEGLTHRGKEFKTNFIQDMLKNSGYTGESNLGNNRYPVIITKEKYDLVQNILSGNRSVKSKETVNAYLANRLIKCPLCGHSYVAGQRNYACLWQRQYKRENVEKCMSPTVNMMVMDEVLWQLSIGLQSIKFMTEESLHSSEERESLKAQITGFEQKAETLKKAGSRLVEMFAKGLMTDSEFETGKRRNDLEIKKIEQEIEFRRNTLEMIESEDSVERNLKMTLKNETGLRNLDWRGKDRLITRDIVRSNIERVEIERTDDDMTEIRITDSRGKEWRVRYRLKNKSAGWYDAGWIYDSKSGNWPVLFQAKPKQIRFMMML